MKQLFFLLGFCLLFFTSCIDILEEMHLTKDGSGKYEVTIDMSALMALGDMKDLFGEEGEEDESAEPEADVPTEMDTIMYFRDAPDSIKQQLDNAKWADKAYVKMKTSDSEQVMFITLGLDFENVSEIDDFLQNLDKLQGDNPAGDMFGGGGGGLFAGANATQLFEYGKKYLKRLPTPKPEDSGVSDEDMAMVKMMFGDAEYTTIYHFPGKVKKTTIPDAVVDGNKVSVTVDFLDVLEGKAKLEGMTKFKKR